MLFMDHVNITAAGHQDRPQTALADAVHGINGDPELRLFDPLHIHDLKDAVDIVVEWIGFLNGSICQSLIVIHLRNLRGSDLRDHLLDFIRHRPVCITAACSKDFDAVIDRRIMTGGDGQTIGDLHPLDGIHDERCGRGSADDQRLVAIACQHFRHPVGSLF